jgi:hypothetical protein
VHEVLAEPPKAAALPQLLLPVLKLIPKFVLVFDCAKAGCVRVMNIAVTAKAIADIKAILTFIFYITSMQYYRTILHIMLIFLLGTKISININVMYIIS